MSNLAHASKSKLAASLERMQSTVKRARQETRQITSRTVNTVLTAGSGYMVGALHNHFGTGEENKVLIPGTEIEADLALGVVISLAGVVGIADDYSEEMCSVGSGILAGYLAIKASKGGFDFDSKSAT